MPLKLITAAALDPVDLATVKAHLRVEHSGDDALIAFYLGAIASTLQGKDGSLGRALITQTWDLYLDAFPCAEILLPLAPLQSVTSIKYDDTNGVEQTISASNYTVDSVSEPGWIAPNANYSWPDTLEAVNAVRVRFVAGYGNNPSDVPPAIRAAILLATATLYEHRESVVVGEQGGAVELPGSVRHLLSTFKVYQ